MALLWAVWRWGNLDMWQFRQVNARWPREGGPVFASHFATWDAAHYLYLSEVGYHPNVPSCAFYPLWPLLVRWSSPVFAGSHVIAGLVLSNLLSLAAWLVFYRLVARRWGKPAADWALVFLVAFPGSLFFQFNYTESLFLLLVLVLWWGLEERRYGWAWLAAGLLPLARGIGVFAGLPIAWHALEPAWPWLRSWWRERGSAAWHSAASRMAHPRRSRLPIGATPGPERRLAAGLEPGQRGEADWKSALLGLPLREMARRAWLLAAPLLGWGIYLALMGYWTGNPFEGFQAQKYWGVHSISNLWNVPKFVVGLFTPTEWHEFRGSVLDRCAFILLLDCLPWLRRLDKGLLVWTYMLGLLPAMSGTFTSFTRFASCAFPLFIALGVFLSAECGVRSAASAPAARCATRDARPSPCRVSLRWLLLAVFVTLHVVLVWRFVNFRWAG